MDEQESAAHEPAEAPRPAPALTRDQVDLIEDAAQGRLDNISDQEAGNALRNGLAPTFVTFAESEEGGTR